MNQLKSRVDIGTSLDLVVRAFLSPSSRFLTHQLQLVVHRSRLLSSKFRMDREGLESLLRKLRSLMGLVEDAFLSRRLRYRTANVVEEFPLGKSRSLMGRGGVESPTQSLKFQTCRFVELGSPLQRWKSQMVLVGQGSLSRNSRFRALERNPLPASGSTLVSVTDLGVN